MNVPRRPVPVLITVRELDQGGVERDVTKIALNLDRERFEPHVAAFYPSGLRYQELRAAGIPILSLPVRSLLSVQAARSAATLNRYIRRHAIKVVHSYDASGVFCIPVARASRVPVTIASQLSYREILDRRTQMLLRLTDSISHAILVNCLALKTYMAQEHHVPSGRIELCYNGVVTSEFSPAENQRVEPMLGRSFVIGTVCALRAEKALTLLQEAFSRVRNLLPEMKLLIVGSGEQLASLQENAVRLDIEESSVFVPATRDVAKWMRSMDIFVLPSYSEGFSNSLLEAMACGCPVIGSRVGGTPELIGSNEERGLLFKSGDAGQLAAQLSKMIENLELRQNLSRPAAAFVRESLSIEVAARCTASIYDKLLQRSVASKVPLAG